MAPPDRVRAEASPGAFTLEKLKSESMGLIYGNTLQSRCGAYVGLCRQAKANPIYAPNSSFLMKIPVPVSSTVTCSPFVNPYLRANVAGIIIVAEMSFKSQILEIWTAFSLVVVLNI